MWQVLENLVRARPLAGSDDQVDLATPMPIQRMVGDTPRVDPSARSWSRHATAVP